MPPLVRNTNKPIIHLVYKTQELLCKAFMRLQEYYESPIPGFKGAIFSREDLKAALVKETGGFTYYEDWGGFNIPGHIVDKWLAEYDGDIHFSEQYMVDAILANRSENLPYYVIGTFEQDDTSTEDHELAHALWYLEPEYKTASQKLLKDLPYSFLSDLLHGIKRMGYTEDVLEDEANAYLSTSTMTDLIRWFPRLKFPWDTVLEFQVNFEDFRDG